ncbi:MAG: hypothetical protein JRG81_07670 [Deltaproteobacteria bacterium]|nr:hypothetical protein [Deltaproteobacteria bacterium]
MNLSNSLNIGSGSKKEVFFKTLMGLSGGAAIVLSFWTAIITAFVIGNSIYILIYADGYKPATFTIEKLSFVKGHRASGKRTSDKYWADGMVDGKKEIFKLGSYITGVIQSQKDLESQVHVGQKLPVLYNPNTPKKLAIRVQYPEKDFKRTWERRQDKMVHTAYMPWFIAMGLCLLSGIGADKIKASFGFCIISLFLVVFAWVPTIMKLLF